MNKITMFLAMIFITAVSQAVEMGVPIQLKLKNPSGVYPDDNNAHFTVQILSPSNGCVLREEDFDNQTVVSGTISLALGSGNRVGYDPNLSLAAVYDNSTAKNNLSCVDVNNALVNSGQSYNPAASDIRILRVRATITGVPIVADFTQRAAPYAIHAESVGGKIASDLLVQNGATALNQTNLESLLLDATRFNKLQNLAVNGVTDSATAATTAETAANFSGSLAGDVTGTQSATVVAAIRGVAVAAVAPVSGQVLGYNGSHYLPVNFTAPDLSGVASAVNTVSSATALATANSLALRDGSGNLAATGLTATGASLQNIYLYESTNTNRVLMRAPNAFANYTLVLPATDGNSGEVLQTDGSGNLSWGGGAQVTSAAITSALGYVPASENDSRITGALQQASFNTYVASANCTAGQSMYWSSVSSTFLCQDIAVQGGGVTSATITAALGYTPANSATVLTRLPALSGDVSSVEGSNVVTVGKIQGVEVSPVAPTAGQLMVYDGAKWTPTTDPVRATRKTADQIFSGTTVANATSLSFSVLSGVTYKFKFNILFSSAATSNGAKFGLTAPAGTLAATAYIPLGGDGIDSIMLGHLTSSGDTVTGTGVQTAGTAYFGYVEGVLVATAAGTLQLTVGSETNASTITVKAGSHGEIQEIP